MTNNPTIDGVSRELIETLHHMGFTHSFMTPAITAQLRAILDAPAVERQAMPDYFVEACDKFDWTPEEALKFYAEGKHFDTENGRSRILCTGAIASYSLKNMGGDYSDMKGSDPVERQEPKTSQVPVLRAMAANYRNGHSWDFLDGEAVSKAADEINFLRSVLSGSSIERAAVAWVEVKSSNEGPYVFHGKERLPEGRHLLYIGTPEVAALQSTIAQLEDRLNKAIDLDFQRRETIARLEDLLWDMRRLPQKRCAAFIVEIIDLLDRPSNGLKSPAAALHDEREIFERNYKPEALERDGDEYVRWPVQMAWEGWEARASLDATAALNGERK